MSVIAQVFFIGLQTYPKISFVNENYALTYYNFTKHDLNYSKFFTFITQIS